MSVERISIGQPSVGEAEAEAVHRVVLSGRLTQGPEVEAAEAKFAELTGVRHAVAVSNGSIALELALRAHGIGAGDEVITTPFTFFATAASILRVGAQPVLVDIDPVTYNIDTSQIAGAITARTAAIMPVHLYGRPCDMPTIMALAAQHDLAVIEDAAQAFGAFHAGRHAGSFGTGCFSLYGSKNITCGEGGVVITDDDAVATRLRRLRNHGSTVQYVHDEVSSNFRMTDLQAAILRVQLDKAEKLTVRRRDNAAFYDSALRVDGLTLPEPDDDVYRSSWHQYTIRVRGDREQWRDALDAEGIDVRPFYPRPVHRQPAWSGDVPSLPCSEHAAASVLSIPVHPGLSTGDRERVADALVRLASR